LEPSTDHIQVHFNGLLLADTTRALRVLETSHPPVYYIPPADIQMAHLHANERRTVCEFKGEAAYYDLEVDGLTASNVGWYYPRPVAAFEALVDHVAFYPSSMDRCTVNGEVVQAQKGDFYGGWVTQNIVGPFKGGPGTWGW
jgi:uncharacterized protein (DUF427 family)